jgi:hypothetical protein
MFVISWEYVHPGEVHNKSRCQIWSSRNKQPSSPSATTNVLQLDDNSGHKSCVAVGGVFQIYQIPPSKEALTLAVVKHSLAQASMFIYYWSTPRSRDVPC